MKAGYVYGSFVAAQGLQGLLWFKIVEFCAVLRQGCHCLFRGLFYLSRFFCHKLYGIQCWPLAVYSAHSNASMHYRTEWSPNQLRLN